LSSRTFKTSGCLVVTGVTQINFVDGDDLKIYDTKSLFNSLIIKY
jgi:hypothetical protein